MDINDAFTRTRPWYKYEYYIEESEGIKCIVPKVNSAETKYYPLDSEPLAKRPKERIEQELVLPQTAFANLDTNNEEAILNFVTTFGLLGLWKHHKYQEDGEFLPKKGTFIYNGKNECSLWFKNPDRENPYDVREPLSIFIAAAKDYKEMLAELSLVEKNPDDAFWVQMKFSDYMRHMRINVFWDYDKHKWANGISFECLLDVIYYLTSLDLQSGKLKQCKKCGKYFVAENPTNIYCSDQCKTAYIKYRFDQKKIIKNIISKHDATFDEQWIDDVTDQFINKGITGKKKIEPKLIKLLDSIEGRRS